MRWLHKKSFILQRMASPWVFGGMRRVGCGRGERGAAIKPNCGRVDCDSLLHCPPLINYICHRICISCIRCIWLYLPVYFSTVFLFLNTWTCSTAVFVTTVVVLRAAVINCFCYKSFLLTNCPNLPIVGPESRGRRSKGNTNTQLTEIQYLSGGSTHSVMLTEYYPF